MTMWENLFQKSSSDATSNVNGKTNICHPYSSEMNEELIICIWAVASNGDRQKYTVKVPYLSTPEQVIAEAIRRKTRSMQITPEQQKQCVLQYQDSYVLKVCGCAQFLLAKYAISQYKVRLCQLCHVPPRFYSRPKKYAFTPLKGLHLKA